MEYKPTDMQRRAKHERYVQEAFAPHLLILRYIRQHLQPCGALDTHSTLLIYRLVMTSLAATKETSAHPLAREGRLQLVLLGLQLVREGRLPQRMQSALQIATYRFALSWYAHPPMYVLIPTIPDYSVTFGNNRIQTTTDYHLLTSLSAGLDRDPDTGEDIREMKRLLQILLKDETFRVHTWLSPLAHDASVTPVILEEGPWPGVVRSAWKLDPVLAVHMSQRFASQSLQREVRRLIVANPEDVIECPLAAQIMLGETLSSDLQFQLKVFRYRTCLTLVPALLDTSRATDGDNLLPPIIWQQSTGPTIRDALATKSFHSSHLLLCPTNRPSSPLRSIRLRRTIHYGSIPPLTPLRTSNYLEHERKRLQGRRLHHSRPSQADARRSDATNDGRSLRRRQEVLRKGILLLRCSNFDLGETEAVYQTVKTGKEGEN